MQSHRVLKVSEKRSKEDKRGHKRGQEGREERGIKELRNSDQ